MSVSVDVDGEIFAKFDDNPALPSAIRQSLHSKPGGVVATVERLHRIFQVLVISMVVEMVPLKGGRWHIIPQLAVYTTYILPSGGLYATYHLLGEPETTIDNRW